jgi:cytochrome c556
MTSFRIPAILLAAFAFAAAHAQSPKPEDQLKLRKAAYGIMNYSLQQVDAMANGKRPYSKEETVRHADVLANVATVPKVMFGEGTDKVGETRAKPEVWTNRADFDAKMDRMVTEAGKLAHAARGGDMAALRKAVHDVDSACNACHDDYRTKRR